MKRILTLILLLISSIFFTGCAQQSTNIDFPTQNSFVPQLSLTQESENTSDLVTTVGGLPAERFTSNDYGFTLLYPRDWQVTETNKQNIRIRDPYPTREIQIQIVPLSTDSSLSEAVVFWRQAYQDDMGYGIIEQGDILSGDSAEACLDLYYKDYSDWVYHVRKYQETLYMKAKPSGYVFQVKCICDELEYDSYSGLFYDVMNNVRILSED